MTNFMSGDYSRLLKVGVYAVSLLLFVLTASTARGMESDDVRGGLADEHTIRVELVRNGKYRDYRSHRAPSRPNVSTSTGPAALKQANKLKTNGSTQVLSHQYVVFRVWNGVRYGRAHFSSLLATDRIDADCLHIGFNPRLAQRCNVPAPSPSDPFTPRPAHQTETPHPAPAPAPAVRVSSHESGFGELIITPPATTLGPGWDYIPVNFPNAVWTDGSPQSLDTNILGSHVRITATPVEYRWDYGDGNLIISTFPGQPWPNHTIWSTYMHEGWYQMNLTVVYEGSFTVNAGPPQHINGTVEITVPPKWIYARSLNTRLVGNNPQSREKYTVPPRTTATLGPQNTNARTTHLTHPMPNQRNATHHQH